MEKKRTRKKLMPTILIYYIQNVAAVHKKMCPLHDLAAK